MHHLKKLFRPSLVLLLSVSTIVSVGHAEESAKSMQQLLRQLESQRYSDRKENQAREQRFLAEKSERQTILRDMQNALKQQEAISTQLEQSFEKNDKNIIEAEARLKQRMGSLSELFGHLSSAAADAQAQSAVSLISLHYPERQAQLQSLLSLSASSAELPSIDQIQQLFVILQQELIEQGRTVNFTAAVSGVDGVTVDQTVTRVGNFNALDANGQYLSLKDGQLQLLARQPVAVSIARDFVAMPSGQLAAFAIDPTGPSGGSLLAALINTPSMVERWRQGGVVGVVISVLGLVALLLGVWRLVVLAGVASRVQRQLKQIDSPADDNPLGRVLAKAADCQGLDLETLELKINEAIIREIPALQRFESFLKISAAIAPLLGLLGTVVGMILTFQAITIYGAGDPQAMAGGISSALVTTVLGLIVAIPTLLMHSFVSSRSAQQLHILEEQAAGIVAEFNEAKS